MRSWNFWKRELKKRLLLGPEDDGIGDTYGQRARLIRLPGMRRRKAVRNQGKSR